jgi:hypothetical protein
MALFLLHLYVSIERMLTFVMASGEGCIFVLFNCNLLYFSKYYEQVDYYCNKLI